jgi:hypothetical protein
MRGFQLKITNDAYAFTCNSSATASSEEGESNFA